MPTTTHSTPQIRQETEADYAAVAELLDAAFPDPEPGHQSEAELVARLRNSSSFIPELSLVAELDGQLVGYILLTKIRIVRPGASYTSLALAPMATHPDHQGKGVGSALIRKAHRKAQAMGFHSIILVGHTTYYPRFGYRRASEFGIVVPFAAPDQNVLAIELEERALAYVNGTVVFDPAFEL